jgi:hypothetical protein
VREVETSTPAASRGMVERDIDRYGKLVREVGMKGVGGSTAGSGRRYRVRFKPNSGKITKPLAHH